MDKFVLRIPTAPQYSFAELHLEFSSYRELDDKVETLNNGLLAKLAVLTNNASAMAKLDGNAIEAMKKWDASIRVVVGDNPPAPEHDGAIEGPAYTDQDEAREAAAEAIVREQFPNATKVSEYDTPAPWESHPQQDTITPPWAGGTKPPAPVTKANIDFDDF